MRKFLFLFILFFHIPNYSFSQNGWYQQAAPVHTFSKQIYFINDQTGWACADSLKVLRTTNGGDHWEMHLAPPFLGIPPLNSIFFLDSLTGWTVSGEYYLSDNQFGCIYSTTNGGISWTFRASSGADFSYIYFKDYSTGFITINNKYDFEFNGSIVMSVNGGNNWFYTDIGGYNFGYQKIFFKDNLTGYAFGVRWTDFGTDSSIILKTTNGGFNWFPSYKKRNLSYRDNFYDMAGSGNTIWAICRFDSILISTDNGDSWNSKYISSLSQLNKLFFIDQITGWIGKSQINSQDTSNMLKTTNGGNNWFDITNPFGRISSIFFINESTGWCGFPGTTYYLSKSNSGGLMTLDLTGNIIPSKYFLCQNYPNPFNPVTKIKFEILPDVRGETQDVRLIIFDALGKEVKTLVNEKMTPGRYEVTFDGSNLPSGVYFYKLEAGSFSQTNRMMMLK